MGCVQCKDKEATKLTDERDTSISQSAGYRYGADPTPQHYPTGFGVTAIPNYNRLRAGLLGEHDRSRVRVHVSKQAAAAQGPLLCPCERPVRRWRGGEDHSSRARSDDCVLVRSGGRGCRVNTGQLNAHAQPPDSCDRPP
ncbi:hypothetical protein AALO_G00107290 [Alosa alosa]|uniref:Uncharacterized protein n=1 Tax=Alosa alosa TaxID=278164 RepID=A0AAV6GN07_9TELE|nr:hypothetical protein AALO_G00107290 [Alosa alosa]